MEDKDYFKHLAVSNSDLTRLKSEMEGKPSMKALQSTLDFGTDFHTLVLQPEKYTEGSNLKQNNIIKAMARKIHGSPAISNMLKSPECEKEVVKFFEWQGVNCKMKADAILHHICIDPKSTSARDHDSFMKSMDDYGYWRQAKFYMIGSGCTQFFFVGVTKTLSPDLFLVPAHNYPEKLQRAETELMELLNLYKSINFEE